MPDRSARRPLDPTALLHIRRRLQRAAQPPWLHAEAARRMAERLPLVRRTPSRVLCWDAALGGGLDALAATYPQAQLFAVEPAPTGAAVPRTGFAWPAWLAPLLGQRRPARQLAAQDVPPAGCELLWSNMGLHFEHDPPALLQRWQQAVAVDGFLMFSTLGPGTLQALQAVYTQQSWGSPLAPLVDMHDLGDMLVQAGFADPVMDQETLTLTWPDAASALAELRGLGGNADPSRHAGLRTPRWRAQLLQALQARAMPDGRIALAFELVYGHAFRAAPRERAASQTRVPLDDMRALVRAGRGGSPPRSEP